MYSPLLDAIQSREWRFAVSLAFKYYLSLVGSFSPSGRNKEGKGIHFLLIRMPLWVDHCWYPSLIELFCQWHAVQSSLLVDRFALFLFSPSWVSHYCSFFQSWLTIDGPLDLPTKRMTDGPCHSLGIRASAPRRLSMKRPNPSIQRGIIVPCRYEFLFVFLSCCIVSKDPHNQPFLLYNDVD